MASHAGCPYVPDGEATGFGLGHIALACVRWFCGCPRKPLYDYGCAISVPFAVSILMVLLFVVMTYIVSVFVSLKRDRNLRSVAGVRWALYSGMFFAMAVAYSVAKWVGYLILVSFVCTLFTGVLRAAGTANAGWVGTAMVFDFVVLCAVSVAMSLLATNPSWSEALHNAANRLRRNEATTNDIPDAYQILRSESGRVASCDTEKGTKSLDRIVFSYKAQCIEVGHELIRKGLLTESQVECSEPSFIIGLPAVVLFRALVRSCKSDVRGVLLADGSEVGTSWKARILPIQLFLDLRDQIRGTDLRLSEDSDLINKFERKLLDEAGVDFPSDGDQKKKGLSSICSKAPPRIIDIYSKVYDITVKITQLRIFREHFREFHMTFLKELHPGQHTFSGKALMLAAQKGDEYEIRTILNSKVDVDVRTPKQATALSCAAIHAKLGVVRLLIEHRANVNAHTADRRTPLWLAAWKGNLNVVTELLKAGADQNKSDINEMSPITIASNCGHRQVAEILYKHGLEEMDRNTSATRQWMEGQMLVRQQEEALSLIERSPAS